MRRKLIALRWIIAMLIAYFCLFVLCSLAILLCIFTLGYRKHDYFYLVSRSFGQIYLRLVGVRVEYEGDIPFPNRQPRIVTFNHTSQLDLFLMASVMPPGGVPAIKHQMLYVPILGQVLLLFGSVVVNRDKSASAHAALSKGAQRIRTQRLSVGISPEGTRARDGRLARFKKGTFYFAKSAQVNVQRLLITGPTILQPMGQWFVSPGVIRVKLLPEMRMPSESDDSEAWTVELRQAFVEAIERDQGGALEGSV